MFGHDYTQEEQAALNAIREREVWGSISPAGLHNDDIMYADSSEDETITLRAENAKLREALKNVKSLTMLADEYTWDDDMQKIHNIAQEALK